MLNNEQVNFLAKAITDSYFQNHEECKTLSPTEYAKRYLVVFEMSKTEVIEQMNVMEKVESQQQSPNAKAFF